MRRLAAVLTLATFAASAAPAAATTYELAPTSTVSNAWSLNGTTVDSALADGVSQPTVPNTSSGYIFRNGNGPTIAEVGVTSPTLGPQATLVRTEAWAYIQPGSARSITLDLRSGGSSLAATTVAQGGSAQWVSVSTTAALTQAQLDALTMRFTLNGSGASSEGRVYAAYVVIVTRDFQLTTGVPPTFSATLNGRDLTVAYTFPMTVEDTRTSGAGWNVTATSTRFSTGGGTPRMLAADASSVTGVAWSCVRGPCVAPTSTLSYPIGVPAGTPAPAAARVVNAAAGTGTGELSVTPTVSVAIPATTYAGTYSSTLTVALVSGP